MVALGATVKASIDMGFPKGHGLADHLDNITVGGFTLAERQLHADVGVDAAGLLHRVDEFCGLDAAILVVLGREGPVAALVHGGLLDVDDRTFHRECRRPGIGVGVIRVRRGDIAMVDIDDHAERNCKLCRFEASIETAALGDGMAKLTTH